MRWALPHKFLIIMCDICHQVPCPPRCPNAPDPVPVFICSGGRNEIYEGDDYWDLFGEQFCEECIREASRVAEYELTCFLNDEIIYEGETYYEIMGRVVCEHCVNDARREAVFDDYPY